MTINKPLGRKTPLGRPRIYLVAGVAVALFFGLAGVSRAAPTDYCSQTADALLDACMASVTDDSFVMKANCINITDDQARNDCFSELGSDRSDATELCQEQHAGRLDACGQLGEARYDPTIDPARFDIPKHPTKPNRYFPLNVGYKWVYQSATQLNPV